jgi:hypothetical protein
MIAGLLVVGAGALYGVGELSGRQDSGEPRPAQPAPQADEETAAPAPASGGGTRVDPGRVTFSVLNGTTVEGLAKQLADRLEAAGFRRGNVANATQQEQAESVVLYADGARREAQVVARRLDISQIEKVDPGSQSLAGDATVVVVAGADKTQ